MSAVEKILELLKTHAWRDKLFRTLVYSCALIASRFPGTKLAIKLASFAAAISSTRAYTRLFGSISAVRTAVLYGIGSKRENPAYRALQVVQNLSDVLFYPAEHMALFCQLNIAPSESKPWWSSRSTVLWAISLFTGIVKNLMLCGALHKARVRILKSDPQAADGESEDLKAINARLGLLRMTLGKDSCDFINAVNWCPGDFLWSGKLGATQSSMLGVVSSIVGIRIMCLG